MLCMQTQKKSCYNTVVEACDHAHTHLLFADMDEYTVLPTPCTTLATVFCKCTYYKAQELVCSTRKQCLSVCPCY